ncbi:unnamed protein product [Prunus armeniaca]
MRGTRVPKEHTSHQSEPSTSGRGKTAAEPISCRGYAPGQYNPNFLEALMGGSLHSVLPEKGSLPISSSPTCIVSPSPRVPITEVGFRPTVSGLPSGGISSVSCRLLRSLGGIGRCFCLAIRNRLQERPSVSTFPSLSRLPVGHWHADQQVINMSFPERFLVVLYCLVGKLKQSRPTQSEIRHVDKVRLKVPVAERVYLRFLFTENLI